jgi:hypothetical protein
MQPETADVLFLQLGEVKSTPIDRRRANASLCVSTNQYKNYISQTLKDFTVLLLPFPDILAFQSS